MSRAELIALAEKHFGNEWFTAANWRAATGGELMAGNAQTTQGALAKGLLERRSEHRLTGPYEYRVVG